MIVYYYFRLAKVIASVALYRLQQYVLLVRAQYDLYDVGSA